LVVSQWRIVTYDGVRPRMLGPLTLLLRCTILPSSPNSQKRLHLLLTGSSCLWCVQAGMPSWADRVLTTESCIASAVLYSVGCPVLASCTLLSYAHYLHFMSSSCTIMNTRHIYAQGPIMYVGDHLRLVGSGGFGHLRSVFASSPQYSSYVRS
jgi:hypothetical protein